MRIADFLSRTLEADRDEVKSQFITALKDLGFSSFAYGELFNNGMVQPLVTEYPSDWVSHYFENNYQAIDPVIYHARQKSSPFWWADMELSPSQKSLMCEAAEMRLHTGLVIPIRSLSGTFVISACSEHRNLDNRSLWKVYLIAAHTHLVLQSHHDPSQHESLTSRETECLTWTARGKSSWDIGSIIGISENTVKFHIKNAARKLQTSSRVLAVVKAIQLGLIQP